MTITHKFSKGNTLPRRILANTNMKAHEVITEGRV